MAKQFLSLAQLPLFFPKRKKFALTEFSDTLADKTLKQPKQGSRIEDPSSQDETRVSHEHHAIVAGVNPYRNQTLKERKR